MQPLLINRHAKRDYTILEEFQAGIVLSGQEVKSLRQKRASINEAFVRILKGEAYLVNATIQPYTHTSEREVDTTRSRKLLLKKREVAALTEMLSSKGLTAVPLMIGLSKNYIKVLVGVGKGKKQYDRKDELKRRDLDRETAKQLKRFG